MARDFWFIEACKVSTEKRQHVKAIFVRLDMASDINVEKLIRDAMERGEFDDLKGKGKPLDLDAYFSTPEDIRMAFAVLKSNKFVPEEVEMFKEVADLKTQLASATDDVQRSELARALHQKQLALTIALEKYKRSR